MYAFSQILFFNSNMSMMNLLEAKKKLSRNLNVCILALKCEYCRVGKVKFLLNPNNKVSIISVTSVDNNCATLCFLICYTMLQYYFLNFNKSKI